MSKPRKIFLSHSSLDGVLATLLEAEMKRELGDDFIVFRSTRADAINSGEQWFNVIRQEMDESDALVVLITETAKNSAWVGFELGYFWRKENIHALYHPRVALPSPFSILQSKKLTVRDELHNFFKTLCANLGVKYEAKANVDAIIALANQIVITPVEDKSLGKFVEYLENGNWSYIGSREKNSSVLWVCSDMTDYEIELHDPEPVYAQQPYQDSFLDYVDTPKFLDFLISNKAIHRLKFIFLEGDKGETLLPVPLQNKSKWYWSRNSLEMKVARIIGKFDGAEPKTPKEFDIKLKKFAREQDIILID